MNLTLNYDEPSDTLFIDGCEPYAEQTSNEIEPGVLTRTNPTTGQIENIEVMFFKERLEKGRPFRVPLEWEAKMLRSA